MTQLQSEIAMLILCVVCILLTMWVSGKATKRWIRVFGFISALILLGACMLHAMLILDLIFK